MNAENQAQLIAKYQELTTIYNTPNPIPASKDPIVLRRWYRDCVIDCNGLTDILRVVELLIADGIEDSDGDNDAQAYEMGKHVVSTLWTQVERQRRELDKTARKLGLTPTEWN